MRTSAVLLVALAVGLSGCTFPWQGEEEDPAALGPPEPISVRFEHDFLGNGRSLPFKLNTSTGTVTIAVHLVQTPGVPACMPDRTPPRVVLKRSEEPFEEIVAGNAVGSPKATEDGSGDCSVTFEKTYPRKRGTWRVDFMGSGNFTGTAAISG